MPLILDLKVVPSSGKSLCVLDKAGALKCYLKNPPEKGKANKELIKMLAKSLGVTHNEVEIIAGATSRKKRVKIDADLSLDTALAKLGIERQMSCF